MILTFTYVCLSRKYRKLFFSLTKYEKEEANEIKRNLSENKSEYAQSYKITDFCKRFAFYHKWCATVPNPLHLLQLIIIKNKIGKFIKELYFRRQ